MYIAKARVNMLDKDNCPFVSDEILGVYLVEQKDNFVNSKYAGTYGYDELVTKERLIDNNTYWGFIDSKAIKSEELGTIKWEIIGKVKAEDLLTEEEIKKYMSISPEQMELYIENMRAKAKEIAVNYYRECHEIVDIGPKLK